MKVLVTGSTGQLGYDVEKQAKELGWEVTGVGSSDLDITNADSSLIFISNTQLTIFPFLNSFDKISIYNSVDLFDRYSTNLLRFDFFFFNILLLVILFVLSKSSNQQSNEKHNFYLNITVLCVIYFNIFGFIAFSDRIAIYTWLFTIFTATLIIFDWKKYNIILVPIVYLIVVFTFAVYTSNLFF